MQQHQNGVRGGMRIEGDTPIEMDVASVVPVRNGAVVIYTPYTLRFAVMLTVANSFLDAHTYLVRGGVFANLQTGNVIFFAIHLSERHWGDSLSRLWPMFAFIAGVVLSSHIKSGRVDKVVAQPLRWTMASQAAVLAGFGFLPATLPHSLVVVPISFLGGIQIGLFRSIGNLAYMPLATTGNLMRVVEAGYDFFVEKNSSSRSAFMVYAGVIGAFAAGAIAGAFTTRAWGLHAIWVPAGLLAVTLILFVIDEREGTASKWWSNARAQVRVVEPGGRRPTTRPGASSTPPPAPAKRPTSRRRRAVWRR